MTPGETLRARRLAAGVTLRGLAKEIGVSAAFLHDVETGKKKLAERHRGPLVRALGLTGRLEEPARGSAAPDGRGPGLSFGSPRAGALPDSARRLPKPNAKATAREIAVESLMVLRERLASCPPPEIPRVTTAIGSATALLARLDGSLEIAESQIVRSKPWRDLLALIKRTLRPYPEAARAFKMALVEYAGK